MTVCGYSLWVVVFICAGVFCASFIDSIAGGGGIIAVPVYLLAGLPPHFALGTNKLSSCIGKSVSTFRYLKNGYVDYFLAIPSALLAMVGASLGTRLQLYIPENWLKYLLVVILPVLAVVLLRQKQLPEQRRSMAPWAQRAIIWGASFLLGAYDGFYGPGVGTFLLLVFCNWGGLDVRTAVGNVKAANFASTIGAVVTSALAGKVLFPIGLIAAVFSIAGHYLGAGLTIKNGTRIVRPVVLVVIALLMVKVLLELFGIGV